MSKLNEIYEGWKNYIFPNVETLKLAEARAKVCATCPHAVEGLISTFLDDDIVDVKGLECGLCSCPLSTKIRSPKSKCEANKWAK